MAFKKFIPKYKPTHGGYRGGHRMRIVCPHCAEFFLKRGMTKSEIARLYGVSPSSVGQMLKGKDYQHCDHLWTLVGIEDDENYKGKKIYQCKKCKELR